MISGNNFVKSKSLLLLFGSWNGYLIMTRHLARCPIPKTLDNADAIYDWAVANLTPDTARRLMWKTIIDRLGIEYRKPYQTRHTFISQQKAIGVEDDQLAKACGTSISMIHKHDAGTIKQVQFHQM